MEVLDLKGVPCPMNWVKTKLALEELGSGEVLGVVLDDGEPIRNVPRSLREEGHRLLRVIPQDGCFCLHIEKA